MKVIVLSSQVCRRCTVNRSLQYYYYNRGATTLLYTYYYCFLVKHRFDILARNGLSSVLFLLLLSSLLLFVCHNIYVLMARTISVCCHTMFASRNRLTEYLVLSISLVVSPYDFGTTAFSKSTCLYEHTNVNRKGRNFEKAKEQARHNKRRS